MNKNFLIFLTLSAIAAIIFIIYPQIDLWVTGLFYEDGRLFLDTNPILTFLHKSVSYLATTMALLWIGLLATSYFKKLPWSLTRRKLAYLILALAIGPGLVVNAVFKDNWGRARPHHTEQFGGTKTFTPAFVMSDQCERNCSFTSGDPSVGFYFFALAFAFPLRRRIFVTTAMTLGAIYGATRIMQGAHFFSDVIFSGVFVFTTCYLLYLIMLKDKTNE